MSYPPPHWQPPQYPPPPAPQRTSRAFANWGIGALAFVLVAIALTVMICCGGAWLEAGHQIQKDEQEQQR